MQIGKRFNRLSISEYHHYIANYKKYTDFNTLGLYRSILENEKLSTDERIALRDRANKTFGKFYNFLQIKDPGTYFDLKTLGLKLTVEDERQLRKEIRHQQQLILKRKRIKHRNFGIYSKHICVDDCYMNGMMVRPNSLMAENNMHFDTDYRRWPAKEKSEKRKKQRKNAHLILQQEFATMD